MDKSRLRLSYLFNCYYSKTATPQECDELFALIAVGKSDQAISELLHTAWDDLHLTTPLFTTKQTDQIFQNILSAAKPDGNIANAKPNRTLFLWTKLMGAAIVLLFLGFGVSQYLHKTKLAHKTPIVNNKPALHDALPGTNKALLTLANGKTIILDNAQNGTLAKQGNTLVRKTDDGKLVYNLSNVGDKNASVSINTITTPRGGEYQVILPDGTKVWLNAASSLKFPTRFTGNTRDVEITGEAYFEVTKNKLMPFIVKTNRAEIEVLGTHFNVMAYDDESIMKTTLLEGAVNIKSGTSTHKLKPGEQAQVNATGNTNITDNIDVDDEVAWKNGIFQFRDAGIDVILRQASRWYDIDITYRGKLTPRELNGRISRNVKASALLSMLNYSGANLHIEGKHIIVE